MSTANKWIYVADPMCSWCYGFAPVFRALTQRYPYPVKFIMGGLAPDSDEPMPESMRQQIASYWYTIEEKTGVSFNHEFWTNNTPYRSTYPACRAVIAAEALQAGHARLMFESIQKAYYQEAKNPSLIETLVHCAEQIGLEASAFKQQMLNQTTQSQLETDFQTRTHLGANGFPSLFLSVQDRIHPITLGYTTIERILSQPLFQDHNLLST